MSAAGEREFVLYTVLWVGDEEEEIGNGTRDRKEGEGAETKRAI